MNGESSNTSEPARPAPLTDSAGPWLVDEAKQFMRRAHRRQTDKAGKPYHEHPERVAARVAKYGPEFEVVALLHDTVEDTDATVGQIERMFGSRIAQAVDALTKRSGESTVDYYTRIVNDPIAEIVKLEGDIPDNSDPKRLAQLPEDVAARLAAKYASAIALAARLRLDRPRSVHVQH